MSLVTDPGEMLRKSVATQLRNIIGDVKNSAQKDVVVLYINIKLPAVERPNYMSCTTATRFNCVGVLIIGKLIV